MNCALILCSARILFGMTMSEFTQPSATKIDGGAGRRLPHVRFDFGHPHYSEMIHYCSQPKSTACAAGCLNTCDAILAPFFFLSTFFLGEQKESALRVIHSAHRPKTSEFDGSAGGRPYHVRSDFGQVTKLSNLPKASRPKSSACAWAASSRAFRIPRPFFRPFLRTSEEMDNTLTRTIQEKCSFSSPWSTQTHNTRSLP
jgi:hypothetical protein